MARPISINCFSFCSPQYFSSYEKRKLRKTPKKQSKNWNWYEVGRSAIHRIELTYFEVGTAYVHRYTVDRCL